LFLLYTTAPAVEDVSRSISEDAPLGASIGLAVAGSDPENDPLSYTLTGISGSELFFQVNNVTGQITSIALLDYEQTPSYIMTIQAMDPSGLLDSCTVTLLVVDVNDAPVLSNMAFTVSELLSSGSTIPLGSTLSGTDEDVADDTDAAPLRYTIVRAPGSVDDSDLNVASIKFAVHPNQDTPSRTRLSSLVLKSGQTLDFESNDYYVFGLQVNDDQGASHTATIKIHVQDQNEISSWGCTAGTPECPYSATDMYSVDVKENSPVGTMFRNVPAEINDPVSSCSPMFVKGSWLYLKIFFITCYILVFLGFYLETCYISRLCFCRNRGHL
jgi:hypothetical protein